MPAVGERVRRDVDDAHHQAAAGRRKAGQVADRPSEDGEAARRGRGREPRATSVAPAEDEAHGLGPGRGVAQLTAHGARDRLGARLADAAHGHAQVLALEDRDHAARA